MHHRAHLRVLATPIRLGPRLTPQHTSTPTPSLLSNHNRTGQDDPTTDRRRLVPGSCSHHPIIPAMNSQQPTTPAPPSTRRKTVAPLRPGLALLLLVCGCCVPLSQAFLPSHSGERGSRARSLLGLGPSSPSPGSSLPLGRKAGLPLYSMLDKGGNKRRRPRRQGNGNESDDEEEEDEEYRAMRPAALDRVRPPPPPRVRPGNCKMGLWREGMHGCAFRV